MKPVRALCVRAGGVGRRRLVADASAGSDPRRVSEEPRRCIPDSATTIDSARPPGIRMLGRAELVVILGMGATIGGHRCNSSV